MQIVFDDGAGRRDLDVRVNDPAATVADLAHALDPSAGRASLRVDGTTLDPDLDLQRESGLYEGAVVALAGAEAAGAAPGATWSGEPALVELRVVNGTDAGRRFPLPRGRALIGRNPDCHVVLDHASVSRSHARLLVRRDGRISVEDLESHNGTWLDGEPVLGPTEVPHGALLRLGGIDVEVLPVDTRDRPDIDPRRDAGLAGTVAFNRPPRSAPPPPLSPVPTPQEPRPSGGKTGFPLVAVVTPLLFAGVMYLSTRQAQTLLFVLMSPLMAVGSALDGKRRGRRSARSERERYQRELAELRERLAERADEERARRRASLPDPAEIGRRVAQPSTTLWERRPEHPDFLLLRAGIGDVAWEPPVVERPGVAVPEEVAAVLDEVATLPRAAVPVDLSGGGVVGLVGDRSAALALARSLVCQATVLHGPADLPVTVLVDPAAADDWDWVKWLPHTRGPSGVDRLLSADPELSARMAEARLEAHRLAVARAGGATRPRPGVGIGGVGGVGAGVAPQGPTLLVVVDDESLTVGRRAPTRSLLRGEAGPVAGIVVAATADRLPAVCTTVIELDGPDGKAHLTRPQRGERVDDFVIAGLADDVARDCARALARFEDPELDLVGAGLPTSIRLLPLLDLDDTTPAAVRARWQRSALDPHRLAAPIGVAETGVFPIDLVGDGPHGLVGGTTGAGKSELLRSLVAGLAAHHDPDHLTFVLIDFKGGAAFDECARLPHTVGLVTDLDEHLAERALRCLEAELKHRERVLRAAGATDLPDYLGLQRRVAGAGAGAGAADVGPALEPLPRLVVIIDEFATLKAELPTFVDALVGIAQRGRSLGVHLLLATQRPQGAISENIKANTNLRIALRVQDRSDSTDIVEVPDAAGIPRSAPGRAYVRLGPGEVVAIQTALSTGERRDDELAPVDVAPFVYGPTPRKPAPAAAEPSPAAGAGAGGSGGAEGADGDDDAPTDLKVLVDVIGEAFEATGRPRPRRPWPDPLPGQVDLAELIAQAEAAVPEGARPAFVPLALADDPDAQAQYPMGWVPGDGNLLLYGVGGSGTTTALAGLALSLAHRHGPDDLHLYVVDMGARELEDLIPLPHVGAVITAGERERQTRLVRVLRDEIARRRQLGAGAVGDLPTIVTLIDGWSAFAAEYGDVAGGVVLDAFQRVFADGPEVGMYTVMTADRPTAIPSSMASLVRQRLAFRLADPSAYTAFGIRSTAVPGTLPPGRALVAGTGQVVQVARPAVGVAQAAARVAERVGAPVSRPPARIETLATELKLSDLQAEARLDDRPWTIPVGITEEALEPAFLVAYPGEHALVTGPARSGKTTALLTVAAVCRRTCPDLTVLAVAGPRSTLVDSPLVDEVVPPVAIGERLQARVDAVEGRVLLLVDDADIVDDVGDTLARLSTSDRDDLLLVAAGRNDTLRSAFTHWTKQLRRSKLGFLLMPNVDYDGDLLGTTIPRRAPVAMTPGRGYLVNSARATLTHLATPT
ncbi:MAG TPA: FtsK/SpoIIIE domain-containing protein [Acidimicrobiales bacterium]